MLKFDLIKYVSKFALSTGAVVLYDSLLEGRGFGSFSIKDGLTFGLSNISSDLITELFFNLANMSKNWIPGMLTSPIFTGIIYMYVYDMMVRPEYSGIFTQRDSTKNFLLGSVSNLLISWFENPILALWGVKNY